MTAPAPAIRVTVIGGYLGAGKTTLLNHLLRHAGRCAVLVNDFGAVAIDADLVGGRDADTIRLTNGCICCSIAGGFAEALATIAAAGERPDRLLIETSGVADPGTVAQYAHRPGFRLDATIVVADAERIRSSATDRYVGRAVLGQLQSADLIALSKADLVSAERRAEVESWLAETIPAARIVDIADGRLPLSVAFEQGLDDRPAAASLAYTHDHDYTAWSVTADEAVDGARLVALATALPPTVLRGKGLLATTVAPGATTVFQMVGPRATTEPATRPLDGPATRLVFIGRAGTDAARAVRHLFDELFTHPVLIEEECP